jgi:hypothetical protein
MSPGSKREVQTINADALSCGRFGVNRHILFRLVELVCEIHSRSIGLA